MNYIVEKSVMLAVVRQDGLKPKLEPIRFHPNWNFARDGLDKKNSNWEIIFELVDVDTKISIHNQQH